MNTLKCSTGERRIRLAVAAWLLWGTLASSPSPTWAGDAPSVPGALKREVYTNIVGLAVQDLTNHAKFPDQPDYVGLVTSFETPIDIGENYGQRLSGFVQPPVSGEYTFYLASDDQSVLYLSTDASATNKIPIAWESTWTFPRSWLGPWPDQGATSTISAPITLEGGRRYYIEALHKEGGGGDNLGVAWKLPGGEAPQNGSPAIPGEYLATPGSDEPPRVVIVTPPGGTSYTAGASILLGANATDPDDGVFEVTFFDNGTFLGKATGSLVTPPGNWILNWENVPAGVHTLTARAMDRMGATTFSAPVQITVLPEGSSRELHAVGVYSGNVNGGSSRNNEEGKAYVTVNRPGKRVTLLLSAYEPVLWSVSATAETTLEKVILAGYYTQRVEGVAADVPIVSLWYQPGNADYLYLGYSLQSCQFYRTLPKVIALTGLGLSSFHGAYTAPAPSPFAIDGVQIDPRLNPDYPQPVPISDLPDLHFQAAFFTATSPGSTGTVYSKSYTLAGIEGGGPLLPNLRVVPDSSQRYFYAAKRQEVMRIDAQTGLAASMTVNAGEVSWPMGMTYDSSRNRVLLVTLGGEGFLYAYAPQTGTWTLLRSMQNVDLGNLVYHAAQDALYGVGVNWGDYGPWTLYRFSPDGVPQGQISLPFVCMDGAEYGADCELISAGDYLVLIMGQESPNAYNTPAESRMYLIDPRTGQVQLTCRQRPHSNTPPVVICPPPQTLTATTETGLATYATLTAQVQDPDTGPLQALWYVDGILKATNNLAAGASASRTAVYQGVFNLGVHTIKVTVSDFLAPPVSCTTTLEVISPLARAYPAREDQQSPALSSDGTNFFAVWLDRRNKAGADWTQCDVYGARVTAGGVVLDRNGILVATNSVWASPPAIGFDGTNYLVAWQQNLPGMSGPIRGTRITRNGAVLDGLGGFRIGEVTGLLQSNPALAFNGRNWLVAWNDWRNQSNGTQDNLICDIYGARITPGGNVLDQQNIPVIRAPLWQTSPAVASLGEAFLVLWRDMNAIRGARVANSGAVSEPFVVSSGNVGDVGSPAIAQLGTNYLAAWDESFNNGNDIVYSWIYAARLTPLGASLDGSGFAVRTNLGLNRMVALSGGKNAAWLAWQGASPYGTNQRIWAATISLGRQVYAANMVTKVASEQSQPAVAVNSRAALAAWHDMRNATNTTYPHLEFGDIYGGILDMRVPPFVPLDFLISSETVATPMVHWAKPAAITYGTPLGTAQLNATSSVPGTFVYTPPAGTMLPAGAGQRLTAVFTPSDLLRYARATNSVLIDVNRALLTIRADDKTKRQGSPNPPLTATYTGFVAGDDSASLDTPVTLTTMATLESPAGDYPIVASAAADANYTIAFQNGTMHVRPPAEGPGSLDLSLDAKLREWGWVQSLARQPDGKLIIAGWFRTSGDLLRTNLARLNPDGSVDSSFNANRLALTEVFTAVLQPDGKILVGVPQLMWFDSLRLGLFRLNADGALDTTFRPGVISEAWGGVRSIALQPDGRILIGGMFGLGTHEVLARLNADGTVDDSFNAGSVYVWEGDDCVVRDLLLQSDGKVVVRGDISEIQGRQVKGLFRLLPDGRLDPNFTTPTGSASSVCLLREGRLLMGGSPDGELAPGLYRLKADGTVDDGFRQTGSRQIVPTALTLQPDGKIIAAGPVSSSENGLVIRLLQDGTLDPVFDSGTGAKGTILRLLSLPAHILAGGAFSEFDGVPRAGLAWLRNEPPVPASFVRRVITNYSIQLVAAPPQGTLAWAVEDQLPPNWAVKVITDGGVWDRANGKVKFGPFFDAEPRTLGYAVLPPLGFVGVGRFAGNASADGKDSPITGDDRIIVAYEHPADQSPADWRMVMSEVTAYASSWRAGTSWPLPPNPIPVDYVTRAAALWRGGETYRLDPGIAGPPLWWVNDPPRAIRQDASNSVPIRAVRRLPPAYVPGEPLEAAIAVTPPPDSLTYAVEEGLPAGWQVRGLSPNAVLDPVHRLIKWGPFFDATPRVLLYTLLPPATATGRTALAGTASADGSRADIDGRDELYPGARLRWNRRQNPVGWTLQLQGSSGARYLVESSTDLSNWTPVATLTSDTGQLEVPNVEPPATGNRYYRAKEIIENTAKSPSVSASE